MVVFNKVDLEVFMKISDIETTLISSRTNYTVNIPSRHGETYNGYKYGSKKITITGDVKGANEKDYERKLNQLACVLNVDGECELIIDTTDRFYYAVPQGDFKIKRITSWMGEVTITFMCYTPFCFDPKAKHYETTNTFFTVKNEGNTPCYPVISMGLTKDCHFVQLENLANKKKMLIGTLPLVTLTSQAEKTDVLNDTCRSTSGWTTGTTSIDSDRSTGGTLAITDKGEGLMCGNFGSGTSTWHGVSARKNLGTQIEDFQVEAFFTHTSSGTNGDPTLGVDITNPSYTSSTVTSGERTEYYQVVCTALNVRTGPSTKYKKVRCLVKGDKINPLEWSGSWARIGNNEWCCCNTAYVQKRYSDTTTVTTTNKTLENYYTTTKTELRQKANPKSFVNCTIPAGTIIRCDSRNWYWDAEERGEDEEPDEPGGNEEYFLELATPYAGYSGYVVRSAITRATNVAITYPEEIETADDKTGILEIYGYSANNEQLFKLSMCDENKYYSFNYPQINVGSKVFLKDNSVAPTPHQVTSQSVSDDKLTVKNEYVLSGAVGNWNNYYGHIGIKRERGYWQAWVQKINGGVVEKEYFSNSMSVSNAPKSKLAYLTLYIGTAGENNKACGMSISDIRVKNLNPIDPARQNIKKFQAGDVVKVDCFNNTIWLNDKRYNNFEIGSQFFPLELGDNTLKVVSDDGSVQTSVVFNEQYL